MGISSSVLNQAPDYKSINSIQDYFYYASTTVTIRRREGMQ